MNYKVLSGAAILLSVFLFSCKNPEQTQNVMYPDLPLLFQAGFEPTTQIVGSQRFTGKDETLKEKNDWEVDFKQFANISVNFTGGEDHQRFAKIIPDPENPENHIMHFQINEGWERARVQCDLSGIHPSFREFYQTVRLYLPEDMRTVAKYPQPIHWLTILELWNNIQWEPSIPYAFRITLGMGKTTAEESDLVFIVDAEDFERTGDRRGYIKIWFTKNHDIKVPIGEWFTMHYYYKEGNAETGRFIVIMETEKKGKQTVFDITNFTHNTSNPEPEGLKMYHPFKLYTSRDLANFMKSQGKALQIYWDDFKLYGK